MVDMDNCVSTGRVSGPQGGPASVAGLAGHHQQPFFHLQINHNSQQINAEGTSWTRQHQHHHHQ